MMWKQYLAAIAVAITLLTGAAELGSMWGTANTKQQDSLDDIADLQKRVHSLEVMVNHTSKEAALRAGVRDTDKPPAASK